MRPYMGGALDKLDREAKYRLLVGEPEGRNFLAEPGVGGKLLKYT
jgi:hypothetical protein